MLVRRLASIYSAAALVIGLSAIGATPGLLLTAETALAAAQSKTCVIRTYYRTADMSEQVGVRTNCPGVSNSGRTSPHVEVERIEYGESSGVGGGGQNTLPCEFLAKGQERCANVPVRRP